MAKSEDGLTTDDKFELLIQALTQRQEGISKDDLAALLAGNATAMQKALKPENQEHPGFASLAHPLGDKAMPRDKVLTHEFIYYNFPVHKFPEASSYWELELAEQVTAGEYRVICKDGSDMPVSVREEKDAKGKVTKVVVDFSVSRETKHSVPPMYVLLYQLLHNAQPERAYVEGMHKWLDLTIGAVPV